MSIFKNLTIDRKVLYAISASLFAVLLLLFFVPSDFGRYTSAVILLGFAVAVPLTVKKRSILSIAKREVLLLMLVIGMLYVTLYYMTGLIFGYYTNYFSFSLNVLVSYIIPISLIIVSIEIIRYVILAQKNTLSNVLMYLAGVTADVLMLSGTGEISSFNRLMDLVGLVLLPSVTANLLYNYVSSKYGFLPVIVYRAVKTLHAYILPVKSAVPDSLFAFAEVIIPTVILAFVYILYEGKSRRAKARPKWYQKAATVLIILIMISVVMLISCQFKYGLIVVGSESMTGELNKGDAVVFEQYEGQDLEVGQVLVFDKGETRTIHRLVRLEYVNGQKRYYTKGDANESEDEGYILDGDIVGFAHFKIAYIGYPTLWVRDIFK